MREHRPGQPGERPPWRRCAAGPYRRTHHPGRYHPAVAQPGAADPAGQCWHSGCPESRMGATSEGLAGCTLAGGGSTRARTKGTGSRQHRSQTLGEAAAAGRPPQPVRLPRSAGLTALGSLCKTSRCILAAPGTSSLRPGPWVAPAGLSGASLGLGDDIACDSRHGGAQRRLHG